MGEYTRRVQVKVELDIWDWSSGSKSDTLDITKDILNYRFQKSIKNPNGSCQLAVLPQSADVHILDIISPMDVIRISEFGTLKFIGYVVRVSYTGSINRDGKPAREATITATQFGGLLAEAAVGFGLGSMVGKKEADPTFSATELITALLNGLTDGLSYSEILTILCDNFQSNLTKLGANNFLTYLSDYLDVSTGLTSSKTPVLPRQFDFYNGTEQRITFWQIAEMLANRPFNEVFMDNGPRRVFIDGTWVEIPTRDTLIFRETPFDGTVNGVSASSFSDMGDGILIDKDFLIRFDLARSMEEVYSVYSVKESAFQLNDITRILTGQNVVDEVRLNKYLYRPLITQLFYTIMEKLDSLGVKVTAGEVDTETKNAANTLKAWFEHNDEYLSGAISHMVPEDNDLDPKIGDKIQVYGIVGAFYVEGVAHTWTYQGPMQSNLTVTRGFNKNEKIHLKDRIFRRNQAR